MGVGYEEEALNLLTEVGGGHPFLTRQLCSYAVRDLERPGTVNLGCAKIAIQDFLDYAYNYFSESLWPIEQGGPPESDSEILCSLAESQPQTEETIIPINITNENRRELQLAMAHLQDQNLIFKNENGWFFTIPLYRLWVSRNILKLGD